MDQKQRRSPRPRNHNTAKGTAKKRDLTPFVLSYQKREAGYLKEQQDWEQFVENAQSILETAAQEWNDLRAKALSALEQSDQDQLRFRDLALAREQQRLREHIARWHRDLEDLRNRGPSIDGEKLLDGIQLVLDFAGFIPVLGAGPDVINTIISAGRGNWGDAAINAIAIIPFWGDAAKGGKMLAKAGQEGVSHVDEISAAVNAVAKNGDEVAGFAKSGFRNLVDSPLPLPKNADDLITKVDNLGSDAGTDLLTGKIFVDRKLWESLTDAQKSRIRHEELSHQARILSHSMPIRQLRKFLYNNFTSVKLYEEFLASKYATQSFSAALRYALTYDGAKGVVYLIGEAGLLGWIYGRLIPENIKEIWND